MADKQPEALRLADVLRALDAAKAHHPSGPGGQMMGAEQYRIVAAGWTFAELHEAADLLVSQHALIAELVEALEEVVATINDDPPSISDTIWCSSGLPCTLLDCCVMALGKAKEAQQ